MRQEAVAGFPLLDKGARALTLALVVTCSLVFVIHVARGLDSGEAMFSDARPVDPRLSLPFKAVDPKELTAGLTPSIKPAPRS